MTDEQIKIISKYKGDPLEERFKPTESNKGIDLFYYWELREKLSAFSLEAISPIDQEISIDQVVLDSHERCSEYFYTGFSRLCFMNEFLGKFIEHEKKGDRFNCDLCFESFFLHFGSFLDVVAGFSNIVFGFELTRNEDRFSSYLEKISESESHKEFYEENSTLINSLNTLKNSLRSRIAHRGKISAFLVPTNEGYYEIKIKKELLNADSGLPTASPSWRKQIIQAYKINSELIAIKTILIDTLKNATDFYNANLKYAINCLPDYLNKGKFQLKAYKQTPISEIVNGQNAFLLKCQCKSYTSFWFEREPEKIQSCLTQKCSRNQINSLYMVKLKGKKA